MSGKSNPYSRLPRAIPVEITPEMMRAMSELSRGHEWFMVKADRELLADAVLAAADEWLRQNPERKK